MTAMTRKFAKPLLIRLADSQLLDTLAVIATSVNNLIVSNLNFIPNQVILFLL